MRLGVVRGVTNNSCLLCTINDILSAISSLGCEAVEIMSHEAEAMEGIDAAYVMPHVRKLDEHMLGFHVVNSLQSHETSCDKIATTRKLWEFGISTPKTIITTNYAEISDFVKASGLAVLKWPYGGAGYGHHLMLFDKKITAINDEGCHEPKDCEDFIMVGSAVVPKPYYAQEFISYNGTQSNDRVYRVFVVGNEAKLGVERVNENAKRLEDSIINVARGAKYRWMSELPQEMERIALQTADAVGFDIGVVDILSDKNQKFYVIECDCDGRLNIVCRKFKHLEEFCPEKDFDRMIAQRLYDIASGAKYRF